MARANGDLQTKVSAVRGVPASASGARRGASQVPQVDSDRLFGPTRRHQPQHPLRTCVGCRSQDDQANLVRVVACDGALVVDRHRSRSGRGAYVHPVRACVTESVRRKTWTRALKVLGPLADAHLWEVLDEDPHPKGERP